MDCYVNLSASLPDFCAQRESDSTLPCRLRSCPNRHHRRPHPARLRHSHRALLDAGSFFQSTASCLYSNTTCLQRLLYLRCLRRCFRSYVFHLALLARISRLGGARSGTDAPASWTEVSAHSSSSKSIFASADFSITLRFANAAGPGPTGCRHNSTAATSVKTSSLL